MADMAKKPLENLYLNGDGFVTKKELRAALGSAHISGVNPETNAILEGALWAGSRQHNLVVRAILCTPPGHPMSTQVAEETSISSCLSAQLR